jgi:hypothetical protein
MKLPFRMRKYLCLLTAGILTLSLLSCNKKDEDPPLVTLAGDAVIDITLNSSFTDPGASAFDEVSGDLAVATSGVVNTNLEGTYTIVYSATDAIGNTGEAIRQVNVVNSAAMYSGSYATVSYSLTDTSAFTSIITTSVTLNNDVWFLGYGLHVTAVVKAHINGQDIEIQKQPAYVQGNYHYYSGSGTIVPGDTLKILLDFSDSLSGVTTVGSSTYQFIN